MLIEIVVHSYAVTLPHVAHALCYQLSSLVFHPPEHCKVRVTICALQGPVDTATFAVLEYFLLYQKLDLSILWFDLPSLGRRSIGRNRAAKHSMADIIWFTDSDMIFGEGCLDGLARYEWPGDCSIVYAGTSWISRDHETGQADLDRVASAARSIDIDPARFIRKTYNRAIGPVQIVRGDYARQYGYLDGDAKWQTVRTDGRPFGDFQDDIAFRKLCLSRGKAYPILLPNLYRMRHLKKSYG